MLLEWMFTVASALASLSLAAASSCPNGSIVNRVCTDCQVGTYATGSTCTACPNGFTTAGSGATSSTDCNVCPAGSFVTTFRSSSTCTVCPVGQYSTTADSTQCSACPDGQTTSSTGSTSRTQCSGCTPGTSGTGGTCSPCGSGTFSSVTGATSCCTCCTGYESSSSSGSTSCTPCSSGYTSTPGGICRRSLSPPVAPSTCTETVSNSVATCPATSNPQPTGGFGKRKRSLTCMRGYEKCVHYSGMGGFECVDTANDPESCGGCVAPEGLSQADISGDDHAIGRDCTAIPGVNMATCRRGQCVIEKCRRGYVRSVDANGQQSCIQPLSINYHLEQF